MCYCQWPGRWRRRSQSDASTIIRTVPPRLVVRAGSALRAGRCSSAACRWLRALKPPGKLKAPLPVERAEQLIKAKRFPREFEMTANLLLLGIIAVISRWIGAGRRRSSPFPSVVLCYAVEMRDHAEKVRARGTRRIIGGAPPSWSTSAGIRGNQGIDAAFVLRRSPMR